jgi:hypothetical protein
MPRRIKRVVQVKERILEAMRQGLAPGPAAQSAGISRTQAYRWRDEDAEFAAAWEEAAALGIDLCEDEAYRRAVDGYNARPIYDKEGVQVGTIKDYSDGLLALILKCRRPEKYNKPAETEVRIENKITKEEAWARLRSMGLPLPIIEGDYKETDAVRTIEDKRDRRGD